jgi:hypothetical protein
MPFAGAVDRKYGNCTPWVRRIKVKISWRCAKMHNHKGTHANVWFKERYEAALRPPPVCPSKYGLSNGDPVAPERAEASTPAIRTTRAAF